MLIQADQPSVFTETAHPSWLDAWLQERDTKAAAKQAKVKAKAVATQESVNPSKRESQRWSRIEKGCEDLQRWMLDQLEIGLGSAASPALAALPSLAARLVDAQAPGLARRLSEANIEPNHPEWPQRLLKLLGELQLIVQAVAMRDNLDPLTQADLRTTLGWTQDKEDIQLSTDQVEDDWQVLGLLQQARDDGLLERRVWLYGQGSHRYALLLDHAFGSSRFAQLWMPNQRFSARLAFYPGNNPQRAIVLESKNGEVSGSFDNWPLNTLDAALDEASRQFSANPWLPRVPWCLSNARFHRQDDTWCLTVEGRKIPTHLRDDAIWEILALSGGAVFDLFGDWDGSYLQLLSVRTADGLWSYNT